MEIRKRTTYITPNGTTETVEVNAHALSTTEAHNERVNWLIQAVAAVAAFINAILFLRIVFMLFDAPHNSLVNALYAMTDPLVAPFRSMVPASLNVTSTGATFDTAAVIAIIAVTLIGWALSLLIGLSYRSLEHDF